MGSEGMQVVFFRGAGRIQPVQRFLEEMPSRMRARADLMLPLHDEER